MSSSGFRWKSHRREQNPRQQHWRKESTCRCYSYAFVCCRLTDHKHHLLIEIIYTHDETSPLLSHNKLPKSDNKQTNRLGDPIALRLHYNIHIKPATATNNCRPTTHRVAVFWDKNMNMQSPAQDFGERVITLNGAHVNNIGGRRARAGAIWELFGKISSSISRYIFAQFIQLLPLVLSSG